MLLSFPLLGGTPSGSEPLTGLLSSLSFSAPTLWVHGLPGFFPRCRPCAFRLSALFLLNGERLWE